MRFAIVAVALARLETCSESFPKMHAAANRSRSLRVCLISRGTARLFHDCDVLAGILCNYFRLAILQGLEVDKISTHAQCKCSGCKKFSRGAKRNSTRGNQVN